MRIGGANLVNGSDSDCAFDCLFVFFVCFCLFFVCLFVYVAVQCAVRTGGGGANLVNGSDSDCALLQTSPPAGSSVNSHQEIEPEIMQSWPA